MTTNNTLSNKFEWTDFSEIEWVDEKTQKTWKEISKSGEQKAEKKTTKKTRKSTKETK